MPNEHFCLKWNNFQKNIVSALGDLKLEEDFVDVTLSCEGKTIKAHKVILSACSDYFRNLFRENPCEHPVVILRDSLFVDVAGLVRYVYKGEVDVDPEHLQSFLKTAELLKIKGLTDQTLLPVDEDVGAGGADTEVSAFAVPASSSDLPPSSTAPHLSSLIGAVRFLEHGRGGQNQMAATPSGSTSGPPKPIASPLIKVPVPPTPHLSSYLKQGGGGESLSGLAQYLSVASSRQRGWDNGEAVSGVRLEETLGVPLSTPPVQSSGNKRRKTTPQKRYGSAQVPMLQELSPSTAHHPQPQHGQQQQLHLLDNHYSGSTSSLTASPVSPQHSNSTDGGEGQLEICEESDRESAPSEEFNGPASMSPPPPKSKRAAILSTTSIINQKLCSAELRSSYGNSHEDKLEHRPSIDKLGSTVVKSEREDREEALNSNASQDSPVNGRKASTSILSNLMLLSPAKTMVDGTIKSAAEGDRGGLAHSGTPLLGTSSLGFVQPGIAVPSSSPSPLSISSQHLLQDSQHTNKAEGLITPSIGYTTPTGSILLPMGQGTMPSLLHLHHQTHHQGSQPGGAQMASRSNAVTSRMAASQQKEQQQQILAAAVASFSAASASPSLVQAAAAVAAAAASAGGGSSSSSQDEVSKGMMFRPSTSPIDASRVFRALTSADMSEAAVAAAASAMRSSTKDCQDVGNVEDRLSRDHSQRRGRPSATKAMKLSGKKISGGRTRNLGAASWSATGKRPGSLDSGNRLAEKGKKEQDLLREGLPEEEMDNNNVVVNADHEGDSNDGKAGEAQEASSATSGGHPRNRWRCMQPRVCNYCWKTFSNSFNLKQHIVNVHVQSQGVSCSLCEKVVKNKWYLRKHLVTAHGAPLKRVKAGGAGNTEGGLVAQPKHSPQKPQQVSPQTQAQVKVATVVADSLAHYQSIVRGHRGQGSNGNISSSSSSPTPVPNSGYGVGIAEPSESRSGMEMLEEDLEDNNTSSDEEELIVDN